MTPVPAPDLTGEERATATEDVRAIAVALGLGGHARPCWDDAMDEMAARWDWDEEMVAFLRDAHRRFEALADRTDGTR